MSVRGQQSAADNYKKHYEQALRLSKLSLFAESIAEMGQAIELAAANGLATEQIQAQIDLAEIMRKTTDFERGLEILFGIENSERFPILHVRKLGRIAAIYHQMSFPQLRQQYDSVMKYLEPAITIAEKNRFELELAGLKNELGYLLGSRQGHEASLFHHIEAAHLFLKNGDRQNYVGAMTKVLSAYATNQFTAEADSLIPLLVKEVENKDWHTAKHELFGIIAKYNLEQKNDTLEYYRNTLLSLESFQAFNDAIHTNQMDNFRVLHQTQKFQNDAEANANAFERQRIKSREMAVYIVILVLLIIIIGLVFYRERSLKHSLNTINKQLKIANDKYQMLIVESNHRIKNNLQMVISMLEYVGKDASNKDVRALKKISGKIYTVSALHKHLYVDVHNEFVSIETFFNEIINLYSDLSPKGFIIKKTFDEVKIRSERIVYFGLIFNEMLCNTVEHSNSIKKEICINIKRQDEVFKFSYVDGSHWIPSIKEGTGSLLIKQLIDRIGGVEYIFNPSIGSYSFLFHA